MEIRRARPDDWRELRELRLDALRDAPATADAAVLLQMYVRPGARGAGVTERLLAAVVEWARSEGFPQLELGVSSDNERAERLYARCGFECTGERIHHDRATTPGSRERCGR